MRTEAGLWPLTSRRPAFRDHTGRVMCARRIRGYRNVGKRLIDTVEPDPAVSTGQRISFNRWTRSLVLQIVIFGVPSPPDRTCKTSCIPAR
jgi:hypothetical protein